MSVTTILGEVDKSQLGVILPHEHSSFNMTSFLSPYDDWQQEMIFNGPITLENRGMLARNPYAVRDNGIMNCPDVLIDEVFEYRKAGGGTWVDLSSSKSRGSSRNIGFTYEIAMKTGLHIVAGTSYRKHDDVDRAVENDSVKELVDEMMKEITVGICGTNMRAGVVGEFMTGKVLTPVERKALEAGAIVQSQTGMGMQIHAYLYNREGATAFDLAVKNGANPEKIALDHLDVMLDMDYIYSMLDRGAYIEFDNFGKEFYCDRSSRNWLEGRFAYDFERVNAIKQIIERGYIKQLLLSNDICLKSMFHKFGGWGYDHILTNIAPMMEDVGITKEQIHTLLVENPADFLDKKEG